MRNLGEWSHEAIPRVLQGVCITVEERSQIVSLVHALQCTSTNWVKQLADIGVSYDLWLEQGLPCPEPLEVAGIPDMLLNCLQRATPIGSPCRQTTSIIIRSFRTICVGAKKWSLVEKGDDGHLHDTHGNVERDSVRNYCNNQRHLYRRQDDHLSLIPLLNTEFHGVAVERSPDVAACFLMHAIVDDAKRLLSQVLANWAYQKYVPRVGPGAVLEGFTALEKWEDISQTDSGLAAYFGIEHFRSGIHALQDDAGLMKPDRPLAHSRVKLAAVDKDLWKKRIITITSNQTAYVQQMLRMRLLACMETSKLSQHLDLFDQSKQQVLARAASESGEMATLDFSDASDNVTWSQVQAVFPPDVVSQLALVRAQEILIPEYMKPEFGETIPMISFDGMGNAATFVVETLMFWAFSQAVQSRFTDCDTPVYVYGDDVIVHYSVVPYLEHVYAALGWKLNKTKSFFLAGGRLRESCGLHAWCGFDITPIRFHGYSDTVHDRIALSTKVMECKDLYPTLVCWLVEEYSIPNIPNAPKGVLAVDVDYMPYTRHESRWNDRYQRIEYRCDTEEPVKTGIAKGTWGLVLASLAGFHYCTSISESRPKLPSLRKPWLKYESWEEFAVALLTSVLRGLHNPPAFKFADNRPWYEVDRPHRSREARGWFPAAHCECQRMTRCLERFLDPLYGMYGEGLKAYTLPTDKDQSIRSEVI